MHTAKQESVKAIFGDCPPGDQDFFFFPPSKSSKLVCRIEWNNKRWMHCEQIFELMQFIVDRWHHIYLRCHSANGIDPCSYFIHRGCLHKVRRRKQPGNVGEIIFKPGFKRRANCFIRMNMHAGWYLSTQPNTCCCIPSKSLPQDTCLCAAP
jgi:hypothetical protein